MSEDNGDSFVWPGVLSARQQQRPKFRGAITLAVQDYEDGSGRSHVYGGELHGSFDATLC